MGTDKALAGATKAAPWERDDDSREVLAGDRGTIPSADDAKSCGGGSSALVESVVLELNTLCKNATFDFAISVGKLIIDTIYCGDLASWRDRGQKRASFRRLARHPDLPMSPSALYRSVAIYELVQRLGAVGWKNVSTSHLRLVLPLAWEWQRELVQQAESHRWSVQRLREEIANRDLRSLNAKALGGRKTQSALRQAILTLQRYVDSSNRLIGGEDDDELSPESARRVAELAGRLQEACALLQKRASRYIDPAHTDPPSTS